ncbi:MAG: hypothetical protein NC390_00830 [Fusobacterium sp.]|nr:hypothetical protein [Fusobacterium sp.]
MSVEISKQIDIRSYSDKNGVTKPAVSPKQQQPVVDEEKSNAAKWMVGLTASAAIVLGGLYAAKHGKLGESAEKWAKKLFGEATKEVQTKAGEATSSLKENTVPALAFITPAFVRGKIKNPKIKLNDFVQELERAKLSFNKIDISLPKPKTNIKLSNAADDSRWSFRFDKDGIMTSIRKQLSDGKDTVYRFKDEVLSSVEHRFTTPANKSLSHVIELDKNGKVERQIYKFELQGGQKVDFETPKFTRSTTPKEKVELTKSTLIEKISEHVSKEEAAAYVKLLDDDSATSTTEIIQNVIRYNSKFKTYQINKPEHITTAVKTIKNCSAKEFLALLKEVAPAKFAKVDDKTFGKTDLLAEIQALTNRSSINENTKILDILQDL